MQALLITLITATAAPTATPIATRHTPMQTAIAVEVFIVPGRYSQRQFNAAFNEPKQIPLALIAR
jgi:hypothetical protein